MKALITGMSGFVGEYLAEQLVEDGFEVWGTSRMKTPPSFSVGAKVNWVYSDLQNEESITKFIDKIEPDHVYHLAGQSNVKKSWLDKTETFEANVNATIRLLEAIRNSKVRESVRILSIGSSEEYGRISPNITSITEEVPLRPISPYGISKATVSMLINHYVDSYGLNIIHARPFNHIGPRQSAGFVTADFAKQIAEIEQNKRPAVITVGNLEAARDFVHVKDIVNAYLNLVRFGKSGETYNVCSGNPTRIADILEYYLSITSVKITVEQDPLLLRPSEFPVYYGSNQKIKKLCDWQINKSLENTLVDILNYWRFTEVSEK